MKIMLLWLRSSESCIIDTGNSRVHKGSDAFVCHEIEGCMGLWYMLCR